MFVKWVPDNGTVCWFLDAVQSLQTLIAFLGTDHRHRVACLGVWDGLIICEFIVRYVLTPFDCNDACFVIDLILPLSNTAPHYIRTTLSYVEGEMWHVVWYMIPGWLYTNIDSRLINWILRVILMPTWLLLVRMQVVITCAVTCYNKVGIRTTVFSISGTVICKWRTHISMGLTRNPSPAPNGIFLDNFINTMAVGALDTCTTRSSNIEVFNEQE